MKTVHIILNSHIDPVWLWSWRDGVDEILNTSRYICRLLDRHPDAIFTRGEAWLYEQILKLDPELFEHIKRHAKAGRWSVVGGWYIQPDCNQPSGFAMQRQIELGKDFFMHHFGDFPKVGYNVDSFGHSASLPDLMAKVGQRYYVYTRPNSKEMAQPARIFRWKGYESGGEVVVFRPPTYTVAAPEEKNILETLEELPEGIDDAMCFIGIGDHGGGPTEEILEWCRSHRESIPGVRLEFSSPDKYFAKVEPQISKLPLHVGELQQHAIGCYSIHNRVKRLVRKSEHALAQAEIAVKNSTDTAVKSALKTAWKRVCFHHFHDTLGGTCIPSAYQDVEVQLGQALAIADEESAMALRRRVVSMPECIHQRLVFQNASDRVFDDYVEIEPWLAWTKWNPQWMLVDDAGEAIHPQAITAESTDKGPAQSRLLFTLRAEAGELKTLRIVASENPYRADRKDLPEATATSLRNRQSVAIDLSRKNDGIEFPGMGRLPLPELVLYDDPTDTWSHGIDRFAKKGRMEAEWESPIQLERGQWMTSFAQKGRIGQSELLSEWRVYEGKPWIEWKLRVNWNEKKRILKLEWKLPEPSDRVDGIMGGSLSRPLDGRELPVRDWVSLKIKADDGRRRHVAIIAPEVYGLDCDRDGLGLSLLRGAVLACHDPNPGTYPLSVYGDRGEQFLRFRFVAGDTLTPEFLDQVAYGWQRPLLSMDVTKGMKTAFRGGEYQPSPL